MHALALLWLASVAAAADPAAGESDPLASDPGSDTEPDPPTDAETETEPAPPDEPAAAEPGEGSFDQFLREAKQRYFRGDREGSLTLFEGLHRRLDAGEDVEWSLASEATFYLGEVYYKLDRPDDARIVFRWLLERDEDAQISPYHHPIDVRGLFYEVKSAVMSERGTPPPPPPVVPLEPVPVWAFAPLGIPQFGQGRTGAGVVYASLQIGLGTASLTLWEQLRQGNRPASPRWEPDEVKRLKFGVQWPVTAAFYGTWIASAVDGSLSWRKTQRAGTTVTLLPSPDGGIALTLGGRL